VPVLAGIGGEAYRDPELFSDGFRTGMLIAAGLVAVGGVIGLLTVRNAVHLAAEPEGPERPGEAPAPAAAAAEPASTRFHCDVRGPALTRCPRSEQQPAATTEDAA
jgi:hypothetical protein